MYPKAFLFCAFTVYSIAVLMTFSVFRIIIEWSESHDRGYGNLQSVKMEDYTFNDLSLKIGFPYLFCHQGNCEHIIIITDIR